MKMIVCKEIVHKPDMPPGTYCTLVEEAGVWNFESITITADGTQREHSMFPKVLTQLRKCLREILDSGAEELVLCTDSFAHMHEQIKNFTTSEIIVEVQETIVEVPTHQH